MDVRKMHTVIYIPWIETEKGGWCVRPDGCSLHLVPHDVAAFEKEYWDKMPNYFLYVYSRPTRDVITVLVSDALFARIQNTKNGLRVKQYDEGELVGSGDMVYNR
jgi:hypothetical protein